jgi:hypothetical protein
MYSRMVVGGKRKCSSGAPKSLKLYGFSAYAFRGFDYAVKCVSVVPPALEVTGDLDKEERRAGRSGYDLGPGST